MFGRTERIYKPVDTQEKNGYYKGMSPLIRCKKCKEPFIPEEMIGKCPNCGEGYNLYEETIQQEDSETPSSINWDVLPPKVEVWLEFISGKRAGEVVKINKSRFIIGRTDGDLIIDDPHVSKKHAAIEIWSRDQMFIKDLESKNGTFLNNILVTRTKLKDGDIIKIGTSLMKFHVKLL
jgi:hypothetical protein